MPTEGKELLQKEKPPFVYKPRTVTGRYYQLGLDMDHLHFILSVDQEGLSTQVRNESQI